MGNRSGTDHVPTNGAGLVTSAPLYSPSDMGYSDLPHHLPCLSDSAVEIGGFLNIMLPIGCWFVDTDA